MAKYLIQDIVPPEKRKRPKVGVAKSPATHHTASPHVAHPAAAHPVHTSHRAPAHKREAVHHLGHKEVAREALATEITHEVAPEVHESTPEAMHYVANEVAHVYEPESVTPPAPRDQSLILEHLYKDANISKQLSTDAATGSWPYNDTEARAQTDRSRSMSTEFPTDGSASQWGKRWLPWILIPTILAVGLFFILNYFSGATVMIIPKHDTIPIPDTQVFTAQKNPTDGSLAFAVMKVTLDDTREVAATGSKMVTSKAQGKIVIYNEQSVPQRLIKNTRFESTAGKTYRINDSITVPKAVTTKTGKLTPGTMSISIYADEAGPSFNSDPSDFTLPGLKNTPQYKKVYARSSGPIVGGASGTTKSVSDQDMRDASDNLRVSLETKLRNKAHGDVASSQIAFDKGIIVDLGDPKLLTDQASSKDKAVLGASGTLYVVVFDRNALTKAVAKGLVPTYAGENIEMGNIDSLSITLPQMSGTLLWSSEKIDFSLHGTPKLTWVVDEDKVKKDLEGVAKSNFNSVMGGYTTIERAKASLRPFWKSTFPTDSNVITLKIVSSIPD